MTTVIKYLSLMSVFVTIAWFFWNPTGWTFQWEPIAAFLASLATFIGLDIHQHQRNRTPYAADIQLFEKLRELLPSTGPVAFLKSHDFLAAFDSSSVHPVMDFAHGWDNAEHQFVDRELEKLRHTLHAAAERFCRTMAKNSSPNKAGLQAVRTDHHHSPEHEERFRREAAEINAAADAFVEAHQALVKRAREKLGNSASN